MQPGFSRLDAQQREREREREREDCAPAHESVNIAYLHGRQARQIQHVARTCHMYVIFNIYMNILPMQYIRH